jgi:hypothetical protein
MKFHVFWSLASSCERVDFFHFLSCQNHRIIGRRRATEAWSVTRVRCRLIIRAGRVAVPIRRVDFEDGEGSGGNERNPQARFAPAKAEHSTTERRPIHRECDRAWLLPRCARDPLARRAGGDAPHPPPRGAVARYGSPAPAEIAAHGRPRRRRMPGDVAGVTALRQRGGTRGRGQDHRGHLCRPCRARCVRRRSLLGGS